MRGLPFSGARLQIDHSILARAEMNICTQGVLKL